MTEFITIGKGNKRRRVPVDNSTVPRSNLARSRPDDKWIQESSNPGHKGYTRAYIFKLYGEKAFNDDANHTIKPEYLEKAIEHAKENHEITWEKRLVRARTLKDLSRKKVAYGEPKGEAVKQAKELRDKGEKVRVIETSKSKDLYAPFVGNLKKDKEGNILEVTVKPNPSARVAAQPKPRATGLGREVHVHITAEGEPRKGGVYIAKITGTDPKYGLKREFLKTDSYYDKHDAKKVFDGKLKAGTIVEVGGGGSWKNRYVHYGVVESNGNIMYYDATSIPNKEKIKNIVKQREKLGIID